MSPDDVINLVVKQGRVLVLDGGLATELEHRGFDLKHALWSARYCFMFHVSGGVRAPVSWG